MIRHLHLAVCKQVYLVLRESRFIKVSLIVEKSGLYLRALIINELDVEKGALAPPILPRLLIVLLSDASLYPPVKQERVQTLDGRVALLALSINDCSTCCHITGIITAMVPI